MQAIFLSIVLITAIGLIIRENKKDKIEHTHKPNPSILHETQTDSYSVFRKNSKCGLAYLPQGGNKVTVLDPEYDTIRVDYTDQDIQVLFSDKKEVIKKHVGWIIEDGFQAVTADGKCGLVRQGNLFTGLVFKQIIKLSFRHYLCINDDSFTIIFFNDCSYEAVNGNGFYFQGKNVGYAPPLGMTKVLDLLFQNSKAEGKSLLKLIKPDGNGKFISRYNHFTAFIDDVDMDWAVQRKIIHDDFSMRELDIEYGAIAEMA